MRNGDGINRQRSFAVLMSDSEIVDLSLISPVSTQCVARTEGTDRAVVFHTDKPEEKGGLDKGPMSSELLAAAVASCHMTTARKIAEKRKVAFESLACRAFVDFDGDDIERLRLAFTVESEGSGKDWETIIRLAGRSCTVGRAVKCPIEHTVKVEK